MREALARHDAIVRGAIESHGGFVVKTRGDGFHAAFATASDAVEAATNAQLGLAGESWSETGPLRVRMGVHTGAAEIRDGDYYGTALNRAARLMSVAHGGQIVCSESTAGLAREALPAGAVFVDLGVHRLRDLGVPDRVFQVSHPQVGSRVPAAGVGGGAPDESSRSADVVRRACARELGVIGEALSGARLVTLTGVGGVGKTRLAIRVGGEMLGDYADGVWFCELAAAGDPVAMVQVVASALTVQPRADVALDGGSRTSSSASSAADLRQLRARARRHVRSRRGDPRELSGRTDPGDEPRAARCRRGTGHTSPFASAARGLRRSLANRIVRRSAAVRRAGERGRSRFRRVGGERGERGTDLCSSRRDTARARARGVTCRVIAPRRDRGAPRRAVPAPHRRAPNRGGTAQDAARDGRLVLLPARRDRAARLRSAGRVRRHVRRAGGGGCGRCRRRQLGRARHPGRPRAQVHREPRRPRRRGQPVPAARDAACVRARASGRGRRGGRRTTPACRPLRGAGRADASGRPHRCGCRRGLSAQRVRHRRHTRRHLVGARLARARGRRARPAHRGEALGRRSTGEAQQRRRGQRRPAPGTRRGRRSGVRGCDSGWARGRRAVHRRRSGPGREACPSGPSPRDGRFLAASWRGGGVQRADLRRYRPRSIRRCPRGRCERDASLRDRPHPVVLRVSRDSDRTHRRRCRRGSTSRRGSREPRSSRSSSRPASPRRSACSGR